MSAKGLCLSPSYKVHRSKELTTLVHEPKPGLPGWIEFEGEPLELTFTTDWNWITTEEYRRRKLEKKKSNIQYYQSHPIELREKREAKKSRSHRLLRVD